MGLCNEQREAQGNRLTARAVCKGPDVFFPSRDRGQRPREGYVVDHWAAI